MMPPTILTIISPLLWRGEDTAIRVTPFWTSLRLSVISTLSYYAGMELMHQASGAARESWLFSKGDLSGNTGGYQLTFAPMIALNPGWFTPDP